MPRVTDVGAFRPFLWTSQTAAGSARFAGSGNGFAFIDPHGENAEVLVSLIPTTRAAEFVNVDLSDHENGVDLNFLADVRPAKRATARQTWSRHSFTSGSPPTSSQTQTYAIGKWRFAANGAATQQAAQMSHAVLCPKSGAMNLRATALQGLHLCQIGIPAPIAAVAFF